MCLCWFSFLYLPPSCLQYNSYKVSEFCNMPLLINIITHDHQAVFDPSIWGQLHEFYPSIFFMLCYFLGSSLFTPSTPVNSTILARIYWVIFNTHCNLNLFLSCYYLVKVQLTALGYYLFILTLTQQSIYLCLFQTNISQSNINLEF